MNLRNATLVTALSYNRGCPLAATATPPYREKQLRRGATSKLNRDEGGAKGRKNSKKERRKTGVDSFSRNCA